MNRKLPWTIKYRPKSINDVIDQDEAKKKILDWIKKWPNVDKKALLLYGPPGVGKTSLIEAIANDLGYELVELNASDNRRKTDIERIAIRTSLSKSLKGYKNKLVLLDEVDGIAVKDDVGGLEAVKVLIESSSIPVIMIANNPWDPKLRELRELCEMVQFKKLSKTDMKKFLQKICVNEGLECEEEALDYIVERSEGDMRAAINDLQAVGEGQNRITIDMVKLLLRPRDKERDPFETLRMIFSANFSWQAKMALNQSQLDYEQLKLWLEENIPYQYQNANDLSRAYEALSRADVYMGRIIRTGDWDLLSYAIDLMTAGVAFSAKNNPKDKYKWTKYSFPQRITLLSKLKEVREIFDDLAKIIATRLHISTSTAKNEVIPFLRSIFASNTLLAAKIAYSMGFSEKIIEFLAGPNKQQVLEYYRQIKKRVENESLSELNNKKQRTAEEKTKKLEKTSRDLLSFTKK
ncbi:MAG: replication factor C large subunit [Ignisphaera sp.]